MGTLLSYVYSIILMGAGVYALLLAHNLLPSKRGKSTNGQNGEQPKNKIQYTIAGIILIYFGISNLYAILL